MFHCFAIRFGSLRGSVNSWPNAHTCVGIGNFVIHQRKSNDMDSLWNTGTSSQHEWFLSLFSRYLVLCPLSPFFTESRIVVHSILWWLSRNSSPFSYLIFRPHWKSRFYVRISSQKRRFMKQNLENRNIFDVEILQKQKLFLFPERNYKTGWFLQ